MRVWASCLVLLLALVCVQGHPNHHSLEEIDTSVPIDSILYLHVFVQLFSWGFLFPFGMVLGLSKSRFHVPVQSTAVLLSFFGYFLGHHHGGREFPPTAHGHAASILFYIILVQAGIGIFLKLHLKWGENTVRPILVRIHGFFGRIFPIIGWVQIVFGFIAVLGICFGEHLGQCLAHFIMGSSFIAYGLLLLLMIRYGAPFLSRKKLSQEYLDSWVIMVWGFINTFTEHNFFGGNSGWSHKDMQHTTLGVMWWAGGALGVWLGRNGKRNIVPGGIIALTGYAMSAHEQSSMMSTKIHTAFGYVLVIAGVARVVEICFIMKEQHYPPSSLSSLGDDEENYESAFQHMTPFFLVAGGILFMSATEEQIVLIEHSHMDHVTYILILISGAFLIYLYSSILIMVYGHSGRNAAPILPHPSSSSEPRSIVSSLLYTLKSLIFFGTRRQNNEENDDYAASYELVDSQAETQQRAKVFDVGDEDPDLGDRYWHHDEEGAEGERHEEEERRQRR